MGIADITLITVLYIFFSFFINVLANIVIFIYLFFCLSLLELPTCDKWINSLFNLQLEKRVHEVEEFYSATCNNHFTASKGSLTMKDKDKEKHFISVKKQQQDASRREAAAAKRMQELMRHFATILRQANTLTFYMPIYCIQFLEVNV